MAGHFIPFVKAAAELGESAPDWSWRKTNEMGSDDILILSGNRVVTNVPNSEIGINRARLMCHAVNYMLELMQQAGGSAECLMRAGQQQAKSEK